MAEGCGDQWAHYCGAIHEAVRYALGRGKGVVVERIAEALVTPVMEVLQ